MSSIGTVEKLIGRRVLNSQGNFTVEVETIGSGGKGVGSTPLGTTNGQFDSPRVSVEEALTRLDQVSRLLAGRDICDQRAIDEILRAVLVEPVHERPAANLACAISLSVCDAAARVRNVPVWRHVSDTFGASPTCPDLAVNVIGGGSHDDTGSPVTEAMLITTGVDIESGIEKLGGALNSLRDMCASRYGAASLAVGVEGGLTPAIESPEELLGLLSETLDGEDHFQCLNIGLDMAGNGLVHSASERVYSMGTLLTRAELVDRYIRWLRDWPRISYLEDPFSDNDVDAWRSLAVLVKDQARGCSLVADDLLATQLYRFTSLEGDQLANSVIAKVDQNGTVSGMADFVQIARKRGMEVVVSQRSQETDQSILVDLAVGMGADTLKAGCISRERIIKYNRLMRIVSMELPKQ